MRNRQRIIFLLFFLVGGAILTGMLIALQSSLLDAIQAKYAPQGIRPTASATMTPAPRVGTP